MTTRRRSADEWNEMAVRALGDALGDEEWAALSDEEWAELYEDQIGRHWKIFREASIPLRRAAQAYAAVIEQGRRKQNVNQVAWGALGVGGVLRNLVGETGEALRRFEDVRRRGRITVGSPKGGRKRAESAAERKKQWCKWAQEFRSHPDFSGEPTRGKRAELVAKIQKLDHKEYPRLRPLKDRTVREALKPVFDEWRTRS